MSTDRVWILIDAKGAKQAKGANNDMTAALEAGFRTFVIDGDAAPFLGLARARVLTIDEHGIREGEEIVAPRVVISSPKDQETALALAGKHDAVLVDAKAWKIIPHENLIAAYRGRGTRLLVEAKGVDEAALLLSTLERGVDIVLLPAAAAAAAAKRFSMAGTESLREAAVTKVKPVGVGDRACLDTASLLAEDEGVLTGSASGGLFLVASEARESGYVASRPFRVNAGAVHAYVLVPGGRTRYLSELHAGDEVLVCGKDGTARPVVLGRVKIERRPLLLVEAELDGRIVKTLLQNAETIRLVGSRGTISVVDLAPGDKVLVRLDEGGRHFGMAVDETVVER
ncbi:MAG TPA: 3-dehydroquinate synthase II [Candidatus Thermoplasmatota archaeon]|nr:3-dehydroquinate synthase II [Candidatus Thermoplasmatota archaeon]